MRSVCSLMLAFVVVLAVAVAPVVACPGSVVVDAGVQLYAPAATVLATPVYQQQVLAVAAPAYVPVAAPAVAYQPAAVVTGYAARAVNVGHVQANTVVRSTTKVRGNVAAQAAASRARAAAARADARAARAASRSTVRTKTVVRGNAAVVPAAVPVPAAVVVPGQLY